jgi:hypothetical protein
VHGGLTFGEIEPCSDHEDGQGFWFGFDCAHWDDATTDPHVKREELSPTALRIFDARRGYGFSGHYWLQSEVETETERLAEQLAGA